MYADVFKIIMQAYNFYGVFTFLMFTLARQKQKQETII